MGAVFCEAVLQMRLPSSAEIGGGLCISHVGGVILHHRTVIGKNCDLSHQVTVGTAGLGRTGVPRIGHDVSIGAGAVLIGDIQVGDGARVAANSLVNRDVPPVREPTAKQVESQPGRRQQDDRNQRD